MDSVMSFLLIFLRFLYNQKSAVETQSLFNLGQNATSVAALKDGYTEALISTLSGVNNSWAPNTCAK